MLSQTKLQLTTVHTTIIIKTHNQDYSPADVKLDTYLQETVSICLFTLSSFQQSQCCVFFCTVIKSKVEPYVLCRA